jgi:23S rRNA (adenine2503-C2)-methyltransferase
MQGAPQETLNLSLQGTTGLDPRSEPPTIFFQNSMREGISEECARRWAGAVIGNGLYEPNEIMHASQIARSFSHIVARPPALTLKQHHCSPTDGFEKLLFQTNDGMSIETVLIPLEKEGRVSLCLSSQVGCVMGCTFCATARMTQRRNLSSWEILDQFIQARGIVRSQGRKVTGAVFMGMGEPFLNFANVITAANWMRFPIRDAISGKAITISTVGLVQEIERYTDMNLPFRLSISLGAATDEKRALLVPVAARTPVQRVMQAARRHALTKKERINLSYVCVSGVNVSEQDARDLATLIGDTPVRLDLIDVTDTSGRYQPPSPEELKAFRDALAHHVRHPVARRYSGGKDIRASCGSLAGATPLLQDAV